LCYNILYQNYINPRFYPTHNPQFLNKEYRKTILANQFSSTSPSLDSDIMCFQEIDSECFRLLMSTKQKSYEGVYFPKPGREEGLAVLVKKASFFLLGSGQLFLNNNKNQALIAHVKHTTTNSTIILSIIHTTGDPKLEHEQLQEVNDVMDYLSYAKSFVDSFIFCGDFNATPDSRTYSAVMSKPNIASAYKEKFLREPLFTFNTGLICKTVDYIFYHSQKLKPTGVLGIPTDNSKVLPNGSNPSDHYPLKADFVITKR